MLVFRKARAGELDENSGLGQLAKLAEIDVEKVGVNGAKEFFEAKVRNTPTYITLLYLVHKFLLLLQFQHINIYILLVIVIV